MINARVFDCTKKSFTNQGTFYFAKEIIKRSFFLKLTEIHINFTQKLYRRRVL